MKKQLAKQPYVAGLGCKNLANYVLKHSTLKKDQFIFTECDGPGYSSFLVARENKLVVLGELCHSRFIEVKQMTGQADIVAVTRFLDRCIKKLGDDKIVVPTLTGDPDMWNEVYRE